MASTQVACGRKRSLLRTLGSRRRHKDLAVSMPAPDFDGITTPTKTIRDVEAAVIPKASPHRHLKRSDKSDKGSVNGHGKFRDDVTASQKIRSGIVNMAPIRPQVPSRNCVGGDRSPLLSPFEMHPVIISTSQSPEKSSVASVPKRSSLEAPSFSHSAGHNRRYTTNSAPLDKTAELLKLLDTSAASIEESLTVKGELDPRAQARPRLGMQEELDEQSSSSLQALGGCVHKASAEEINSKLREMLAATDALKPATPQKAQGSRKLYRTASARVFSRMSDAIGRMYNKSASPEVRPRDEEGTIRLEETDKPIRRSSSHANASQHSIRSIEIRLNEGSNLDRRKVQQLIGSQVFRKPVTLDRKPALCRQLDDQTDMPGSMMPVGRHGSRSRSISPSTNPFEAEEDFENDLESGILQASPGGCSTPRICINRGSGSSYGDDYDGDLSGSSIGQVNLARIVVKVGKNDVGSPQVRQVHLQSSADVKDLSPKPWQRSKRCRDVQHDDFGIAKKHPSPSKRDLEELELAFQKYKLREACHAEDDADELANSRASLGDALTAKDPNKKLRGHVEQGKTTIIPQRPTTRTVSSRIPRPSSQVGERKSTGTRLAADCRPRNAVPGEPDELL
ncbi:uncharacterized protein MAM_05067 [Metarhizium album ARSEF 1941]|uniref:Uncharacterized protein n=1 Tax=Metarhizium album (strain ARSEF 1941) TaxID=1081103 RepID=A0A0B2WSF2_METAS|nr:uncharacterized protein MAM_05067 [Metarhizium album ARSEF 1941]KHN96958.1 hypothetical protein MAM_05067 [Metarhizium album ARSEF 1941]